MKQRVFITGATGFIGSRLAERLIKKNIETHICVRSTSNLWRIRDFQQQLVIHALDLHDAEKISDTINKVRPDYVFDLACYGGFTEQDDQLITLQTNILAVHHLLQACAYAKIKHFFYIGSSSEYGINADAMSEQMREQPYSIYGISKLTATHLARWYGEQGILPTTILRVFSPYGAYDDPKRLIPYVIRACFEKLPLRLGSGKQVRDYIYIDDLIDAFCVALQKAPGKGEIINIGSGQQNRIIEVVNLILNACGSPIQPEWNAIPDRKNEPETWMANITKAATILGWHPKTSLQSGIESTIKWAQQRWENHESF